MSLYAELKRRSVLKACMAYIVLCWLVLQITDVLIPILDLPNWVAKLIFLLLLLGLPIVTILSWSFDLKGGELLRDPADIDYSQGSLRRDGMGGAEPARKTRCCAIVTMTALYAIGIAATIHLRESQQIGLDMHRLSAALATELDRSLAHESADMETLRARISKFEAFSFADFETYAGRLLAEHPDVQAVEWVPRVRKEDVGSFQRLMAARYPGYMIKQFDQVGHELEQLEGEEFFPVAHTMPRAGNDNVIGFDLGSQPQRRAAIEKSIESGRDQLSAIVTLVQTGRPGLLLLKPVFGASIFPVNHVARRQNIEGFVLSVLDVDKMLQRSLLAANSVHEFEGRITLAHAENSDASPVAAFSNNPSREYAHTYKAVAVLGERFGVDLRLQIEPSRAMVRDLYSKLHWWVGAIGLLMAIFFAAALRGRGQVVTGHQGQSAKAVSVLVAPTSKPVGLAGSEGLINLPGDHP